jgi:hypothetical protein
MLEHLAGHPTRFRIHSSIPWNNIRLYNRYLLMRTRADHYRKEAYSKVLHATLDYIIARRPQDTGLRDEYFLNLCTRSARDTSRHSFANILNPVANESRDSDKQLDVVLAAAAVLKLHDVFTHCLEEGAQCEMTVFGHPMWIAAGNADLEIVNLLLQRTSKRHVVAGAREAAFNGHTKLMQRIFDTQDYRDAATRYSSGRRQSLWQQYAYLLEYSLLGGQRKSPLNTLF